MTFPIRLSPLALSLTVLGGPVSGHPSYSYRPLLGGKWKGLREIMTLVARKSPPRGNPPVGLLREKCDAR